LLTPEKKTQYIIVGQGLAGSLLAYRLIQNNQSVLVLDNNHVGSSSKVAAGIINPITGYRLTTNNQFSQQQLSANDLYAELEKSFKHTFQVHLKQTRLLKSAEQVQYWQKRTRHKNYIDFTGEHFKQHPQLQKNEFGLVTIKQSSRIYVSELLSSLKNWLFESNVYRAIKVDYKSLVVNSDNLEINGFKTNKIIFCEGYQAIHNPWWQHLPFKLSKGEILKVQLNQTIQQLLNWRQWIIPEHGNESDTAFLGANYEWGDFHTPTALTISESARDFLLSSLNNNTQLTARVLSQSAGIRPTPTHRFPYIGAHPKEARLYCFNGFGSKGCVTIPYYSQVLIEHLLHQKPLPEDVTQWL